MNRKAKLSFMISGIFVGAAVVLGNIFQIGIVHKWLSVLIFWGLACSLDSGLFQLWKETPAEKDAKRTCLLIGFVIVTLAFGVSTIPTIIQIVAFYK